MKETAILYATNKEYLTITLASMLSLIEHSNNEDLKIYLMTENLEQEDYNLIKEVAKKYPKISLNVQSIDEFHIERHQIPGWQETQAANARLFFQEILGDNIKDIEEILYLDSDTIIVGDLTELDQYNGKIYATLDNAMPSYLSQLGVTRYFNSGVLKINTSWWKKERCEERIIKFVRDNPTKKLTYPDQDVLNCVLGKEISPLPIAYNLPPSVNIMNNLLLNLYCKKTNRNLEEIKEAKKDPGIIHSYGLLGIKPWTENKVNPYNDIFRQYIDEVDPDFEIKKISFPKKIIANSPGIINGLFLLQSCTPECLEEATKKASMKFYKVKKKECDRNNK